MPTTATTSRSPSGFIDRTADANLAFVEELFEETVDECLALKRHIAEQRLEDAVGRRRNAVDGSTCSSRSSRPRRSTCCKGDMKHFGFEGILDEAEMGRPQGVLVAPHNWGSLIGYYMQLHVGRAITNFYRAEHDPLSTDVLVADGYAIKDGAATVPDSAGFGLTLDEAKFAGGVKMRFDARG